LLCGYVGVGGDVSSQNIGILVSWMLDHPMSDEAEAAAPPLSAPATIRDASTISDLLSCVNDLSSAADLPLVRDR